MKRPVVRLPAQRWGPQPLRTLWVHDFNDEAVARFASDLSLVRHAQQPVCPIVITSWGGHVYSLYAMVDLLANYDGIVATIALGQAMSCGAALMTCGTDGYRFAAPKATFLLHDISNEPGESKVEDLKTNAREVERLSKDLWTMMETNIKKPKGFLSKQNQSRHHADWYLTAQEALKIGLVNRIGIPLFEVVSRLDPMLHPQEE